MNEKFIQKYKAVSFDIFDTLVERNVDSPEDIFKKVGKMVFGENKADQFCNQRKRAEIEARKRQNSGEVTLNQIYNELCSKYDNDTIDLLRSTEIEMEIQSCYKKGSTKKIYEMCLKLKKDIFLISDMYLPYDVIERILEKCNINGYCKIYISNIYGKNKISGELFDIVLHENSIKPSEIIHIGDSIRADFIGARKVKIKSFLIGRKNRIGRLIHL